MPKRSAGLLMWRRIDRTVEVLLVHPGGPYWAKKDAGAWTIPKGEIEPDEDPLAAARREFKEETGADAVGPCTDLGSVTLKSGKEIRAWSLHGDFDPSRLTSTTFTMEWPPGSGKQRTFPEVDRAAWFTLEKAALAINPGQAPLLDRLREILLDAHTQG